jgi:hypothetical protein
MVRGSKRKSTSKRRQSSLIEEGTRKRGSSKRGSVLGSATVSKLESGGKKGSVGRGKKRSTTSTRIGDRKASRRLGRGRGRKSR